MPHRRIKRRNALATGCAVGMPAVFGQSVAAAREIRDLSFVIVSDTHLGRNNNTSAERNWRTAISEINQLPGRFVLHLGDVVDGGREAQYSVFNETCEELKKPIYAVPGNHDPVEHFRRHICRSADRSFDEGGVRFVLFNNAHRDSHDGFISRQQLAWLDEQFREAASRKLKIVVCCHVPVHTNRPPDRAWYVKPAHGQTEFYDLLERYQRDTLACFHGHFHNGIRGWRDHGDTVESLMPSICYNQNRGLKQRIADGKADGFFVDELRPGFVLAKIHRGQMTLRYKPLTNGINGQYTADWR